MRPTLLILALLLLGSSLLACGATPAPQSVSERAVAATRIVVEEVQVAAAEATAALLPTPSPAAAPPGSPGLAAPTVPRAERMIIKNAEMDLLVADTDVALDGVTVIAADYGGYIISSHTWFEDAYKYATVRLGVPVVEFENVLRRLRGLALKVQSEVASGEDVSDQYVDLQSRLTNLQATRDRIRQFLDQAQTVEEALKVNEQLSQVEAQIEEIQGRMNYLRDRSAYSTIDVQFNPEQPTPTPTPTATPTPTPTPIAWRPGETFQDASGVLGSLVKGLVELGIWILVVLGPFLIPLGLIIWLVVWLRRRRKPPVSPPNQGAQE